MVDEGTPPNVVAIVVDALRADHVSCSPYGPDCTPEIGAFSEEATVFERAIAPAPWTLPSVTSLLTGRDPHDHGATSQGFALSGGTPLQRELAEAGYRTVHVSPTTWIGDWLPQGRGFETVREFTGPTHRRFPQGADVRDLSEGVARGWRWYTQVLSRAISHEAPVKSLANVAAFLAGEWTEDAWLDDRDASRRAAALASHELARTADDDRPLFMLVHLMDPHLPFYPPERHRSQARPPGCSSWEDEVTWMRDLMDDIWRVRNGERVLDGHEIDFLGTRYRDSVRTADEAVGTILRRLETEGLREDTVVALTADHGEHLGERVAGRTMVDHQASVRLPVLQVPLLLDVPEQAAQRRLDLVQPHDLASTFRALAGLDHDPRRNLLSPLDETERVALASYAGVVPSHPPEGQDTGFVTRSRASAVLGEWKVDVHRDGDGLPTVEAIDEVDRVTHVDWANGETTEAPLSAVPAEVRERLERRLQAIEPVATSPGARIQAPEPGLERRLRQLGYLD